MMTLFKKLPFVVAVLLGILLALNTMHERWKQGHVVAESASGHIRVREVPLVMKSWMVPGATETCYVIEAGAHYPPEVTFRFVLDCYEADRVRIQHPAEDKAWQFEVHFNEQYTVLGRRGGDLPGAEWQTRAR